MCSPKVAQVVQERIKKEGGVSRRGFLKLGGLLAASVAAAPGLSLASPRRQGTSLKVVDLTHVFSTDFPVFPGFEKAMRETLVTVEENGYYAQRWTFGEHTGTHMDFPAHFVADGANVEEIDAEMLVGPAVVIDISERAAEDPDATVTIEDIEAWESENGEIPEGAFVFMYSGWEARVADEAEYINADEEGKMHFPGFSAEAAEFLANERNLHGVGVDTLSLDYGLSAAFEAHFHFLSAGLLGVENLANLAEIKGKTATIVCGVPKYQEGSGGPARILALVEE